MTPEIVKSISERYIELYEQIVGENFEKPDNENVLNRVESGIKQALSSL